MTTNWIGSKDVNLGVAAANDIGRGFEFAKPQAAEAFLVRKVPQ